MAVKAVKTTIEPPIAPPVDELNFDFESMIADEILDNLDWSKVKTAMLTKGIYRELYELLHGLAADLPFNQKVKAALQRLEAAKIVS